MEGENLIHVSLFGDLICIRIHDLPLSTSAIVHIPSLVNITKVAEKSMYSRF